MTLERAQDLRNSFNNGDFGEDIEPYFNDLITFFKFMKKYGLLGELGVAQEKITTNAMGEQNPIDDNNTEEGRLNNRRVEIWLRK